MEQKLKVALSMLGVLLILIIGFAIINFNNDSPEITTINQTKKSTKNEITTEKQITPTNSSVIGDKKTDESVNAVINEVLSDDDIDSEIEDMEIILSEENEVDQINNLFNENEL